MQDFAVKRVNKNLINSSEIALRRVSHTRPKQEQFGTLPYKFSKEALNTIQQVYSVKNRYVRSAIHTVEGIEATVYVESLLGIKKEMSYVPASTISAIVSQCSALALWSVLRREVDNPTTIYNRLVEDELVGFKKEHPVYYKRIPLKTEIHVFIEIMRVVRFNGNIAIVERISLGEYMDTEILGYAFLNKIQRK